MARSVSFRGRARTGPAEVAQRHPRRLSEATICRYRVLVQAGRGETFHHGEAVGGGLRGAPGEALAGDPPALIEIVADITKDHSLVEFHQPR